MATRGSGGIIYELRVAESEVRSNSSHIAYAQVHAKLDEHELQGSMVARRWKAPLRPLKLSSMLAVLGVGLTKESAREDGSAKIGERLALLHLTDRTSGWCKKQWQTP